MVISTAASHVQLDVPIWILSLRHRALRALLVPTRASQVRLAPSALQVIGLVWVLVRVKSVRQAGLITTTGQAPRVKIARPAKSRQMQRPRGNARRVPLANTLLPPRVSALTVLLGSMTMIITHPQFALRVPLASRQTPVPIQPAAPNVDLVGTKQTGCVHVVSPVNTMTTATKLLCARTALLGRWVQKRELPAVLVAQQDSTVPKGRRLAPTASLVHLTMTRVLHRCAIHTLVTSSVILPCRSNQSLHVP